jgi:KTSC domain
MNRIRVASSNLYSIGYDPLSLTLEIQFRSGDVYRYFRVPVGVHERLMSASSKGSYFAQVIRDTYSYALVA